MSEKRNFKINDLVLIHQSDVPRAFWPLARVIAVQPSSDGLVRQATVKTKDEKTFQRPINKLFLLEATLDAEEVDNETEDGLEDREGSKSNSESNSTTPEN